MIIKSLAELELEKEKGQQFEILNYITGDWVSCDIELMNNKAMEYAVKNTYLRVNKINQ